MSDIIVTTSMAEDLLHRNKVNIKLLKEEIERLNERIKDRKGRIKQLEKAHVNLLKVLEEAKQNEVQ